MLYCYTLLLYLNLLCVPLCTALCFVSGREKILHMLSCTKYGWSFSYCIIRWGFACWGRRYMYATTSPTYYFTSRERCNTCWTMYSLLKHNNISLHRTRNTHKRSKKGQDVKDKTICWILEHYEFFHYVYIYIYNTKIS